MQTLGSDRVWAIPLPDAMRIKRVFLISENGRCRFLGDPLSRAETPSNLSRFEDLRHLAQCPSFSSPKARRFSMTAAGKLIPG